MHALTASHVSAFLGSRDAFMHVYGRDSSRVVKLVRQTDGGLAIRQPSGVSERYADPAAIARRVNEIVGLTPAARRPRYSFKPRHLGGLHVLFTTDENQVVVIWRTRAEGSNEIETVSSTIWAAYNEGEIGGFDLSPRQQDWITSLMEEANAWTAVLHQQGKLSSTGGRPDPTPRHYSVPVRSSNGRSRYRLVKPD